MFTLCDVLHETKQKTLESALYRLVPVNLFWNQTCDGLACHLGTGGGRGVRNISHIYFMESRDKQ